MSFNWSNRKQNESRNFNRLLDKAGNERVTRTAVIEARTDIRLLARLDEFYQKNGVLVQSRSELVRSSLELLHDYLVQNGKIENFDRMAFTDAYDQLARLGNLHRLEQNKRRLVAEMAREEMVSDYRQTFQPTENAQYTPEQVEQIKERTKEGARRSGLMEQDKEEQLPDSASLLIGPAIVVED